jgi:regulatory protein YycH of two-component signal transduction system YycFG
VRASVEKSGRCCRNFIPAENSLSFNKQKKALFGDATIMKSHENWINSLH